MKLFAVSLLSVVAAAAAAHHVDLEEKYTFSNVLKDDDDGYYKLYWNFTIATESIYFAVNVSTTGWVGFGLSPNGLMPGSDVVIGWVNNGGKTYFHDRYAEGRFLPPIDPSQDWFLVNSEEEDDFTLLEFSRNFTTCDTRDLDIMASTSRVVWSYSATDPTDPTGAGAAQHDFAGSRSINLISGLPNRIEFPENQEFIQITVSNVTIPVASTTYWCETVELPPLLTNTTQYNNRYAQVLTPHSRAFVHHILVYICPQPLGEDDAGVSVPCANLTSRSILSCYQGVFLGGWAIGGEEFIYPEGVSFPIGGTGQPLYALLEMHYDNPNNVDGVIDSSGMKFYLTSEEPDKRAGILRIGHRINPIMIIPPKSANYTIASVCNTSCIDSSIPEEGIRIFGNFLHTHLAGHGLVVEHYRYNTECGRLEELEPIDRNLNYDFNLQQTTHLPKEHLVLPGDILVLKCFYDTSDRTTLTTGGESTAEEMCLSFLTFYPLPASDILDVCFSSVTQAAFIDFSIYLNSIDPDLAAGLNNESTFFPTLMNLDWDENPQYAKELQYSVLNSTSFGICITPTRFRRGFDISVPESECPFEAPDKCSDVSPPTCCERISTQSDGVPPQIHLSIGIALLMVFLSLLQIV